MLGASIAIVCVLSTVAYKMRTVDVTRRLSMYKRSEGKKTN